MGLHPEKKSMYWKTLGMVAVAAAALAGVAGAQTQNQNWDMCAGDDADRAITACTALIRSGQENPENLSIAFNDRANAYITTGDLDRAMQDLNESIRLNPDYATAYYNRGIIYERKAGNESGDAATRDHERAIQEYSQAIRLRPSSKCDSKTGICGYPSALNNRGSNYDDIGEYDRAIADFDEALRLNPREGMAFNNRCFVFLFRKKDYDRAIQDCTQALSINPTAKRYFNRGEAYRMKHNYTQAVADLTESIRLDPGYADSYCSRGLAKQSNGDAAGGQADIDKAKQLNPRMACP
jgi:tetratricopeptide (TPR) repeat protein